MAKTDAEFRALMKRVLNGSEEAAQELFRDYEPYLLQVIRRRLDQRYRSKFDSLDFAQDVWASFFAEDSEKRVFRTSGDLLAFLARLAHNKVIDATHRRQPGREKAGGWEQSLDDSTALDKNELAGSEPTPSQEVSKEDEWRAFLRKQPLVYRRIFVLLREGKSTGEIAKEMDIHPRTVLRVAQRVAPGLLP
jgi:RNA polymerase sigma factor (sigma-70 family)